jgi:hypothetical protein
MPIANQIFLLILFVSVIHCLFVSAIYKQQWIKRIADSVTESFVSRIARNDAINYISMLAELKSLGLKF